MMNNMDDVSGQQVAQPESTSPAGGVPSAGQSLDPSLIQRVVEETVEKALSAYERRQQSQRDKLEARVSKRLAAYEETLKSVLGQELTAEQRNQLRQKAEKEVLDEERETGKDQAVPPAQAKQDAGLPESPIAALIMKKFQKAGLMIEDGDPEVEMLLQANPEDLDDLKARIDAAIEAKKARLNSSSKNAVGRIPATAGLPGTPGNPLAEVNDPDKLWELARKKR